LAVRLGPEAVELFDRASANCTRPLRLVRPAEIFQEQIEFENPVETAQPLLLILRRFLEQISLRLEMASRVAEELTLRLIFSDARSDDAPSCSADFQSAVSPISNRQSVVSSQALVFSKAPQAGSAAIQQIGNLRYAGAYEHVFKIPAPTRQIEPLFRMLQ